MRRLQHGEPLDSGDAHQHGDNTELAGGGSMIPAHWTYVQQLEAYERQTRAVGLYPKHGLRHRCAQTRYEEIIGWKAPAAGRAAAAFADRCEAVDRQGGAQDHRAGARR